MHTKRLGYVVALALGLTTALLGLLQTARAAPDDLLFAKPDGSGTTCTQAYPCALQKALTKANDNTIYAAGGIYTGTGAAVITITKSITLYGGWDGTGSGPVIRNPAVYSTILDGGGARRGIIIQGNFAATLDGLHVTNGYVSDEHGAGIRATMVHLTLRNCQIYGNTAAGGHLWAGGIAILTGDNVLLENNRIFNNTGSGITILTSSGVVLHNNQVHVNAGADRGGGVQVQGGRDIALIGNSVVSNTAASSAGGIWMMGTEAVTLTGNVIHSNTANNGGGLYATNVHTLTLEGNVFHHNRAIDGNAGGLFLYQGDALCLHNNIIVHNAAGGYGSGVDLYSNVVRMTHNTLARNAGTRGQGLYLAGDARLWMTNTILVSQTVGIEVGWGAAHIEGTLWGSGAWANVADWINDDTLITGTVNVRGDPAFVDPDGSDYHIGPGSAAIDAGVDAGVTTDVDGDARPAPAGTRPDLGADEVSQRRVFLPLVVRDS